MRVLMLGWEFPPFIAGGLGTACYGLTKALDSLGVEVLFVLPKAVDKTHASHVRLLSPETIAEQGEAATSTGTTPASSAAKTEGGLRPLRSASARTRSETETYTVDEFQNVVFQAVPSGLASPYADLSGMTEEERAEFHARREYQRMREATGETGDHASVETPGDEESLEVAPGVKLDRAAPGADYGGDLINDVRNYAALCLDLVRGQEFDVIHAHDWMTYPAGMLIARLTGKPLVAHIHSTEFDRSGEHVNQIVYDIERRGMHSAMRVAAVSYWTKNIVVRRYGVDPSKIRVVWNGVEQKPSATVASNIASRDKIVLFLGRITMQKGPEFFVAAAKKVLEKIDNVKFLVAGSGDMANRMIELAAEMGIGHKVLFTGFLRGDDVARAYRLADLYVMPSVSEPFGIAPLEAMSHDVPVIISKQSGVSEVLKHALKVDFWDVDEMANKIIAVLRHPPLSQTLRRHQQFELRSLTWEGAARKVVDIYDEAAAGLIANV